MIQPSPQWYLENIDMFRFLFPRNSKAVPESSQDDLKQMFIKGDFIYRANDPALQIYLLEEGRVKIGTYSESGKEIIKAILQPGEIFGESMILGAKQRSNFARALDTSVQVIPLNLEKLKRLMRVNADFSLRITRLIGLRLEQTERRLDALVFKDARTRIVDFLREMAEEYGKVETTGILIENFLTHKEMASMTATSRQTVTSILNELREQNLILFDRKEFRILDLEQLH